MNQDYEAPKLNKNNFTCPHCNRHASQFWTSWESHAAHISFGGDGKTIDITKCSRCKAYSVWHGGKMVDPLVSFAPKPDDNMPDNVKEMYEEASLVSIHSPRAAAVLLRVATERLTAHLGETTDILYDRIRNLAQKEHFDKRVIKCFDIVRVKANKGGAHDDIINQITSTEDINKLFFAINYIVEQTITKPKEIDEIYGEIPQNNREQIAKDDKPKETQ